jgi:hypothetical protein
MIRTMAATASQHLAVNPSFPDRVCGLDKVASAV